MNNIDNRIIDLIKRYDLSIFPLYGIKNNICSCNNIECDRAGKHPYYKNNWKLIGTGDIKKIEYWDRELKNINWAIISGNKNKINNKFLYIVDIDEIDNEVIKLMPQTFSYKTGNGYHFWYFSSSEVKSSYKKYNKIDIKGTDGYVIIPPSKHINGKQYELYHDYFNITEIDYKDIQDIIDNNSNNKNKVYTAKNIAKQTNIIAKANNATISVGLLRNNIIQDKKIGIGTRNIAIHKLLSSDRGNGATRDTLIDNSYYYNNKLCDIKLDNNELHKIINNVIKYPINNNSYNLKRSAAPTKNIEYKPTDIDIRFFKEKLTKTSLPVITLEEILDSRINFYLQNNIKSHNIPKINVQKFCKYMQNDLGFNKKRYSSGIKWFLTIKI